MQLFRLYLPFLLLTGIVVVACSGCNSKSSDAQQTTPAGMQVSQPGKLSYDPAAYKARVAQRRAAENQ